MNIEHLQRDKIINSPFSQLMLNLIGFQELVDLVGGKIIQGLLGFSIIDISASFDPITLGVDQDRLISHVVVSVDNC